MQDINLEAIDVRLPLQETKLQKRYEPVIRARKPVKKELIKLRVLVLMGLFFMTFFLVWFFSEDHKGNKLLYGLLTTAIIFKLLRWVHEWIHYFHVTVPDKPKLSRDYTVDVFTTYCPGEPKGMIINTLLAIKNITYPHETYLCDEANDQELKDFCREHGIHHMTREVKKNAKAGNINNALLQSDGEICIVLDPDHIPVPQFIDRVLPYFENPKVGFVQCVQAYGNQGDSLVAKGAAEQTYHFYGPLMMGMHKLGTVQAIGANCTFRREALNSIGGHAAGLSEDMHTAMQLHAKGWESVYIPEALSRGQVPNSMSAYFKQQLKWSRGTFELLFVTYPRLFRHFTFNQKLHYFFLPLYYLFGIISFIDILVPCLCLTLSEVAWKVRLDDFLQMYMPVFFCTLFIRMHAQQWLIEKEERGFHIVGGLLRMGTWWIYIAGFICTLFRVKIPYIPTPKEDEPENEWKRSLPNLLAAGVCIGSIYWGLSRDWNPYSWAMAAFAGVNALILIAVFLMAQQKLLNSIGAFRPVAAIKQQLYSFSKKTYDAISFALHRSAFAAGILICLSSFAFTLIPDEDVRDESKITALEKNYGGFYLGMYIPEVDATNSLSPVEKIAGSFKTNFDIISIYQHWGPESIQQFPSDLLNKIRRSGAIPMITWEPYSKSFPEFKNDPNLSVNWKIFDGILSGKLDNYITAYATKIRDFGEPVMMRFAHEMDNPAYPWSFYGGGNTPEEFVLAHQYIVKYFNKMGATNVTWIWNPWEEEDLEKYYPGDDFVDWIGLTNLNYGLANSNGKWVGFEDLYKPFHDKIMKYNKPVMLSEFGSTNYGGDRGAWFKDAFEKIKTKYPEIRSLVFFYSDNDKNWGATKWRPADGSAMINWRFDKEDKAIAAIREELTSAPFNKRPSQAAGIVWQDIKVPAYRSKFVTGPYPNFTLLADNKPFFIKGVAYNVNQDWRDGNEPLTRKKLEEDFTLIKAMGANTIRRYAPTLYDDNLLTVAGEQGLKVLYGFWFENNKDYLTDKDKLADYREEVIATVKKYKDNKAILGWTLGNEVWGLLKHHYGQPYLTIQRKQYILFIEQLAEEIHKIDPYHPVLAVAENSKQLPGEISGFARLAPSLDVIGINSYYEEQLGVLPNIQYMFDTTRPYLVSEYGPQGYWDSYYSTFTADGRVTEDAGFTKASLYSSRWDKHIEGKKGFNVGGVAYTWCDRMEGTYTWFGLTDYKGRLKPAYFALKEKWTGSKEPFGIKDVYIYAPKEKIAPGKEATFYAITENVNTDGLQYEWMLCDKDYMKYSTGLKTDDNGKRVTFTIPADRKGLRLYLFVSDKNAGKVNTASIPVLN